MNGSADETKQNSPPPTTNGSGGKRGPKKKIPGLIEKYNLDAIGSKMASLWTHPDKSERATLNDLRHMLNRAMLESAAKSAGADPVAGELEHGYEQLTSDDANHADREDFVDRMEMKGVDIDEVESDFIKSSATIHSYLQDVEGAEYPTESTKNRANKALNHVQRLKIRAETVSETWIDSLVESGDLPEGDYSVSVQFHVDNQETGERHFIESLIEDHTDESGDFDESS